jgi:hypothetical protein
MPVGLLATMPGARVYRTATSGPTVWEYGSLLFFAACRPGNGLVEQFLKVRVFIGQVIVA